MQSVKNILEFREKSSAALGEGLNGYQLSHLSALSLRVRFFSNCRG